MRPITSAAFFDVDETVISAKSIFEFLRYWLARHGDDGSGYAAVSGQIFELARTGCPRSEVNRAFYRIFRGVPLSELIAAGTDWYADYRARPDAFVVATAEAITDHRRRGDVVVLVSGSCLACLLPLADDVQADHVLCSELVVDDSGIATGEIVIPMIGAEKASAVRGLAWELGIPLSACSAYGDHASDLEMLRCVGHARVVGDDPVLSRQASELGWPTLSARTGPRSPS